LRKLGHKKRRQDVPGLCFGPHRTWRSQEYRADGGTPAPDRYDRLHHFISDGIWDAGPLEAELAVQADKIVGALDAFLVIDDTGLPKKDDHSVGVAPQYASSSVSAPIARRCCR
jgi:SRSO17 transposase